jgi:hypothetical protein
MELLLQVVSTLLLVLGIAAGETLATKAFGALKHAWMYLVEIALFVVIIVSIFNTIVLSESNLYYLLAVYFCSGLLTIIFVRAIFSGAGILAVRAKEVLLKEKKEMDYVLGLKKALERRGFKEKEIKRVAKEAGFSEKTIRDSIEWKSK